MRNDPVFQSILDGPDLAKKAKKWVIFGGFGWLFLVGLSAMASLAFFGLSVWVVVLVLKATGVL